MHGVPERTFVTLTPERLAKLIMEAQKRVIYAAPSLSLDLAAALINAYDRLGGSAVAIVLDVSEGVFRLGYGVVEAVGLLRERHLEVRHAEGLRISLVVIDDVGFIFVLPPLLVEDDRRADGHPNAIRASSEQIDQLVRAVLPPSRQENLQLDGAPASSPVAIGQAEIGQETALPSQVEKIEAAISLNPVQNFDLSRVVNVFSSYIQFYELEIRGTQVQNQTVQLPKELLVSVRDKATRDRLTQAFKLVASDSKVSGDKVRRRAAEIRQKFIHHHAVYGGVILKSALPALEAEIGKLEALIEEHKKIVLNRFDHDAERSVEKLVRAFWQNIKRNPPGSLVVQLGRKPTSEEAQEYLRYVIKQAFPVADKVVSEMRISRVVKDVTWSTLNEPGFVDWLKKQFHMRKDLQTPFDLFQAAREAMTKSDIGARGPLP